MTGIASMKVFNYNIEEAVKVVKNTNEKIATLLGINKAARLTCVKPAGTTSLTLGTSSGIHAWHNPYYIRRIRVGKTEAIYNYLLQNHPEVVEDDKFIPHLQAVISIPQKAPENAVTRHETALDLLERIKNISDNWVKPGHRKGNNTHNVSATISIDSSRMYKLGDFVSKKELEEELNHWREIGGRDGYIREGVYAEDIIEGILSDEHYTEWEAVGEWMWKNREVYNGLSVLPYDGGTYVQAPFEDITEEEYYKLESTLHSINLSKIVEETDETNLTGELACAGGVCEVK